MRIAGAALVVLGISPSRNVHARGLEPGMRTMIQRGGGEGTLLGSIPPVPVVRRSVHPAAVGWQPEYRRNVRVRLRNARETGAGRGYRIGD